MSLYGKWLRQVALSRRSVAWLPMGEMWKLVNLQIAVCNDFELVTIYEAVRRVSKFLPLSIVDRSFPS